MKKHIIMTLIAVMTVICVAFILTACGDENSAEKEGHEHRFAVHKSTREYLNSEATCTEAATYYYSCACGEKGEGTYKSGEPLGHIGGTATCTELAICDRCDEEYGKLAPNNHNYEDGICTRCGDIRTKKLSYTLSADKTYYIVKKGSCSSEDIYIPARYEGLPVASIGDNAFESAKIKSVSIPNSITSIGNNAFKSCKLLKSVTIPDSVTSMGFGVFDGCRTLMGARLPKNITSISDYTFGDCWDLKTIIIPGTVTRIGDGAFQKSGIASITIPTSVTSIGDDAFYNCGAIKSLTIPETVTDIGLRAFCGCSSLESIALPSTLTTISCAMFWGCGSLTTITIPETVTSIESSAFSDCKKLAAITIPSAVESVGSGAFFNCSALTSIEFPDSVLTIGDSMFVNCFNLTHIVIPRSVTSISYSFVNNGQQHVDIYYGGSEEEWEQVSLHSGIANNNVTVHYNYKNNLS